MAADRRLLIVGYGPRGRAWERAAAGRRGTAVVGVVDPAEEARRAAEARGIRTWARLDDALADAGAGAGVIASPPAAHADDAVRAMAAGLDVLIEKPLALSIADAARVAAAAEGGRLALVAQNFRLLPRERTIRAALDGGRLGRPRESTVVACRPATPGRDGLDGAERELWDIAIHHLDLARRRAGATPAVVRAARSPGIWSWRPTG